MPYANNAGVRIHYEVEGAGPPLVLQTGLSGRIENWRSLGYVSALRDDYRLILIDARGHGQSDKPHDEASYAFDRVVADVRSSRLRWHTLLLGNMVISGREAAGGSSTSGSVSL